MDTRPGAATGGFRPPLLGERYVVCERLGRGGTAGVYLVFDLKLRAWHAAKVLHAECAGDPEIRHRFAREATTMARLSHPNIVRVVDVASEEATPYLVMEYLEGGCVLDWVRRHGPMPAALAVSCLVDICHALEALHENGGVHRDVKPHNMLVHRTGACKLTDFGIARLGPPRDTSRSDDVLDDEHLTQAGTVMGTAAFMAPEQRVDASAVDARADVYSAGASLYTLMTAKAAPDLCMAQPDDPRFEELPDLVVEVLLKACAYSPGERYPSARRMADALSFVSRSVFTPPDVPPLADQPRELPSSPPARLTAKQARHLGDLVQEGAVRALYDPHDAGTAPPLPDRELVAPPMLADEDNLTQLMNDGATPRPELAEMETFLRQQTDEEDEDSLAVDITPPPVAPTLAEPPPRPSALDETPPPAVFPDLRDKVRERTSIEAEHREQRRSLVPVFVVLGGLLILGGAGTTVGALLAARGARQVGEGQRHGLETAQRYYSVLHHNQPVIDDLARHGAEREDLERAWFKFQDATSNDKHRAAAEFWSVLSDEYQAARARASGDSAMPTATAAYQDISEARDTYAEAVGEWEETTTTIPGRLAVTLGLAVPPPDTPP